MGGASLTKTFGGVAVGGIYYNKMDYRKGEWYAKMFLNSSYCCSIFLDYNLEVLLRFNCKKGGGTN